MRILRYLSLAALLICSQTLVAMKALEKKQWRVANEQLQQAQESAPMAPGIRSHILKVNVESLLGSQVVQNVKSAIVNAVARINGEVIEPYNQNVNKGWEEYHKRSAEIDAVYKRNQAKIEQYKKDKTRYTPEPLPARLPKPLWGPRPLITFDPANLHITLAYIGHMNTVHSDYQTTMKKVKDAVETALNVWKGSIQCQPLVLKIGDILWPPFGADKLIWVALEVKPESDEVGASLLALLNQIQVGLAGVQSECKNCLEDKFGIAKEFKPYNNLDEVGLHISIGRLNPPFAVYDVINGKISDTPNNSGYYFTKFVDEDKINKILGLKVHSGATIKVANKSETKKSILGNKNLPKPSFSLNSFDFSSQGMNQERTERSFGLSCGN